MNDNIKMNNESVADKKPASPLRRIWRLIVIILSAILFIIGIPLLVLPGPGLLCLFLSFLLLSTEYDWAKKFVHKFRKKKNSHVKKL